MIHSIFNVLWSNYKQSPHMDISIWMISHVLEDIMKALRLIYLLLKLKMIGTGVHSHNPHTALSASP